MRQKQKDLDELQPVRIDISKFSIEEMFEVFATKEMKQYRDQLKLIGTDLSGRVLTQEEMVASIKLYYLSQKNGEETLSITQDIDFDIDHASKAAFDKREPFQQKIIVKANTEYNKSPRYYRVGSVDKQQQDLPGI